MTEEHIKESISISFIELIANYLGFSTDAPKKDYGRDLSIFEIKYREENGSKRRIETGRELKIQAKSTTLKGIKQNKDYITYNLEAKTFNDLIDRKNANKPLILILFLLPENRTDWLTLNGEELIVRKCAYWYYPEDINHTTNLYSESIKIPTSNLITIDSFKELFENFS
ncbi:MAG: DUF4365 domain-containing protein [Spirosomataceae bacterium]